MKSIFLALGMLFSVQLWAAEVELLSATSKTGQEMFTGINFQKFNAIIKVQNLGFEKQVYAQVNTTVDELPTSTAIQAEFNSPADAGFEIWHIDYELCRGPSCDEVGFRDLSFSINFEFEGQQFIDDNSGALYQLGANEGTLLTTPEIQVLEFEPACLNPRAPCKSFNGRAFGEIAVQNIGPEKQVDIIYTADGASDENVVPATFATPFPGFDNPNAQGVEIWRMNLDTNADEIAFKVRYQVNGETYIDDNFGNLYHLKAAKFPSLYLRGTFNNWQITQMSISSDWQAHYTHTAVVEFSANETAAFKFDATTTWAENYGDNRPADGVLDNRGANIILDSAGRYSISVDEQTMRYTAERLGEAQRPIADAGEDISAAVGQAVTLDGSGSYDPDGDIVSYRWTTNFFEFEEGETVSWQFDEAGEYTVHLEVTDNDGFSQSDTVVVTVSDDLPSVYPSMFLPGSHNSWSTSATPMELVAPYLWEVTLVLAGDDRFKFTAYSNWSVNWGAGPENTGVRGGPNIQVNSSDGEYRVQFNDQTLRYTVARIGNPANRPPVAVNLTDVTLIVGQSLQLSASGSSDPDGDELSYTWTGYDGVGLNGPQPEFTFNEAGSFDITLTVTDTGGLSDSSTLTVTVNQAPSKVDVTFECRNGTTFFGQNIFVVGNLPELGNWNPANAVKLNPTSYPTWTGIIKLDPSVNVQWKCIKKYNSAVQWQSGGNTTYTTPTTSTGKTSGSF